MAQFYNITIEEMDAFLSPLGFSRIQLPGTKELVYGKRVDQSGMQLSLRVYTGIDPSGQSRDVGEDAMRVNLFMRLPNNEIRKIFGSKRVHRVKGWMKNLKSRIEEAVQKVPTKKCDKCGLPMIVRSGKFGNFLSCVGYPNCKNSQNIGTFREFIESCGFD